VHRRLLEQDDAAIDVTGVGKDGGSRDRAAVVREVRGAVAAAAAVGCRVMASLLVIGAPAAETQLLLPTAVNATHDFDQEESDLVVLLVEGVDVVADFLLDPSASGGVVEGSVSRGAALRAAKRANV
jgi:hypothetical protein